MSNEKITTGAVTYEAPKAAETAQTERPKVKITYDQAIKQLEKPHKLAKMNCELAEFRTRELIAQMHYMELLSRYNSKDPANQGPLVKPAEDGPSLNENTGVPPTEEQVEQIS